MLNKPVVLSLILLSVACSTAPKNAPVPQRAGISDSTRAGGDSGRAGGNAQPRPYNRV